MKRHVPSLHSVRIIQNLCLMFYSFKLFCNKTRDRSYSISISRMVLTDEMWVS